jgi:hypothetical protein
VPETQLQFAGIVQVNLREHYMDQIEVAYRKGFEFGMGVKASTGSPLGQGVVGDETPVKDAIGGKGTFQMTRIQSTEELESHLGISAEVSGGIGLFSASDRFTFAKECKIQTTSLMLLVQCTRQLGFIQIDNPALSPTAAALTAGGNGELFSERYGDCFVRGMTRGGQFFGLIRIDTQSNEARETIVNKLSGTYGAFSAEVSGNISDAMKATSSSADIRIYYEGGRVVTQPQSPQDLLKASQEWAGSVEAEPVPYSVTLAPYVVADGPEPTNKEDLQHQHDVLVRCAKMRSATLDKQNLVDYVVDPSHRDEFEFAPGGADLDSLAAGLSLDLDVIAEAASHAIEHPKEALEPEPYARQIKGMAGYVLTKIPTNMPNHRGATSVVPDFRAAKSQVDAIALATAKRLTLHWVESADIDVGWHVASQDLAPGTPVPVGTTITLECPRVVHLLPHARRQAAVGALV